MRSIGALAAIDQARRGAGWEGTGGNKSSSEGPADPFGRNSRQGNAPPHRRLETFRPVPQYGRRGCANSLHGGLFQDAAAIIG